MNTELLFALTFVSCIVSVVTFILSIIEDSWKGLLISLTMIALCSFGMCYSTIPESEYRKTSTEEIHIFEFDHVQWGILPTEPKSTVNLNEYFGRIISKDEGVVQQHYSRGPYRKFLYKNIPAKLEVIKLPKYHRNGLAMETIL